MASKRSETALRYHICKDAGYKKPCEKGPPPDNGVGRDRNQGETIMQAPSFELIGETANEQKGLKSDKNKLCIDQSSTPIYQPKQRNWTAQQVTGDRNN